MTSYFPNQCSSCVRYKKDQTCEAFPKEIPDDIFWYGADHRSPVEGDGGKQYKGDPKKRQFLLDWLSFNNN